MDVRDELKARRYRRSSWARSQNFSPFEAVAGAIDGSLNHFEKVSRAFEADAHNPSCRDTCSNVLLCLIDTKSIGTFGQAASPSTESQ
jgi:hypothetical protein